MPRLEAHLSEGSDCVIEYHLHRFLLLRGVEVEDGAVLRVRLCHVPGILLTFPAMQKLLISSLAVLRGSLEL